MLGNWKNHCPDKSVAGCDEEYSMAFPRGRFHCNAILPGGKF